MAQDDEPIGIDARKTVIPPMKKVFVLATWLICGSAPLLRAQQPPPTPRPSPTPRPTLPPGPLLNRAPEFAQWSVISRTVPDLAAASPSATPAPKSSRPPVDQTLTVTKTRTIRSEQTTGIGGAQIQKWCVPDMQVVVRGSGNPVVALPGASGDSAYTDYSRTDFGGFEWISKRNFEGIQKVMNQDCLVFRDKMKLEGENARSGPPPSAVAAINADSRLPVALQLGEETRTYQFGPAPTEMLTLPPKIDALINQWRKTLHQASLPPAKP